MGTKLHSKSYLPGYYSMRNLNEDSSSSNWPLCGGKTLGNGQCYNGFLPRNITSTYPGGDKDALKQKMLEHEAVFKQQVLELHRLYKVQREMMDEIKMKELYKHQIQIETSSSSIPMLSKIPSEDVWKWHKTSFPLTNSVSARPSVSGAEIISSPPSCSKGNNTQTGQLPSHNGCSSMDCEILETRPSKVRKKLFDLQLPADVYLDTEGEQSPENRMSDVSSYHRSRNHKMASESSVKLCLGESAKTNCDGDASRSGSCYRDSVGLADLNEPIQFEEPTRPTSIDFLDPAACHAETENLDKAAKSKSQFLLGLPKEILQNSQQGSNSGTCSYPHVENRGNGREWLFNMPEAGHSKTHLNSISQGSQPHNSLMSSQPAHPTLNKLHQPLGTLPSDHRRRELWSEGTVNGLELSESSHDHSTFNHLEPVLASHLPNAYPMVHASDFDNAWPHISTWGKPSRCLGQKFASIQQHSSLHSLGTSSRTSQLSGQRHEIFVDKCLLNSSSGSKPGFRSVLPNGNRFYHGSSSSLKDAPPSFPSAGFDYFSCSKDDMVASERSTNYGPGRILKCPNLVDVKPAKEMNLNIGLSKCSPNEVVTHQGLEIIDDEEPFKILPWLRAKPATKNEHTSIGRDSNSSGPSFLRAVSNQLSEKIDIVKGPNQLLTQKMTSASCDYEVQMKRNEVGDCLVNRKILGFPIFDNPCNPKNESSSLLSTSASLRCPAQGEDIKYESKNGVIDINLACDPESGSQIAEEELVVENDRDKKSSNFRNIDLNSCVSEDEVTVAPSVASTITNMKIAVEIDLEAPAVPETAEDILLVEHQKHNEVPMRSPQHKAEQPQDENVRTAAQAIVTISSSSHLSHVEITTCHSLEAPASDPLLWFVEIVSSWVGDLDKKSGTESKGKDGGDNEVSSSDEIDYFEAVTLKLTEIKEEEYMPKPLVPENLQVEEIGTISLPNRTRKGPARRGRQRRDFQRDILPGLASLSRHEVTEDLQTFGGLMRATGHPWQSGLMRRNGTRNGGARGRRRAVVDPAPAVAPSTVCTPLMEQLNNIEARLEDRSLAGWGKTPRRPRRQRCPAGNLPLVTLT
ncbi:uncharacterized protein LOC127797765 [Diospyros lotus]|uniref:uncharacterized protein LOC127797765 n=1 Tax=Diospyros lotus TaxID=55363 RepID=UPI00225B1AC0|nr:uncharacterized protein LOC127797765 [Diospyros lotus]XP_052186866.1 uncharacterized protein LOC127797765 [Diospyros lotus]